MKNQTLDGVRGLLCWGIVAVHIAWLTGFHNSNWHVLGAGIVCLFVLISGFTIGRLLLHRKERYHVFIARRFFRLAPCYFVALGLAIAFRPLVAGYLPTESLREASENAYWWQHIAWHLSLMHGLSPLPLGGYAFLPPMWSTSLEWQLYLLAPVLLFVLVRFPHPFGYLITAFGLIVTLFSIAGRLPIPEACGLSRVGVFMMGMLCSLRDWSAIPRIPWPGWLIFAGKRSYSIFVIHYSVLAGIAAGMPAARGQIDKLATLILAGVPLVILASEGLHLMVEIPSIEFGKRLFRNKVSCPNHSITKN